MEYDNIVVGSGLSAVGVLEGLPAWSKTLVLTGAPNGRFRYYARGGVPREFTSKGGLGDYWHGVIPLHDCSYLSGSAGAFQHLLARYFSGVSEACSPQLFVPWVPIRSSRLLGRLVRDRGGRLEVRHAEATAVSVTDHGAAVEFDGELAHGARLWLAAGALGTPRLLSRSGFGRLLRGTVSDHVQIYLGTTHGVEELAPRFSTSGLLFSRQLHETECALYSKRPAYFDFRQLDAGFSARAAFGLPTGGIISKVFRNASPGLVMEALFNKFGLFGTGKTQSAYAQVRIKSAYTYNATSDELQADDAQIASQIRDARAEQPYESLTETRYPSRYLPGIHLHGSVCTVEIAKSGVFANGGPITIVDASAHSDIGACHHSFRVMANAYRLATEAEHS